MKWTKQPLSKVADLCLGKMLDEKKNKGQPLPYLANINVRWGTFDLDNLREMRFEENELERYGLKYGDIVMCEGGEPGRCAIWKEAMPGMMIQKAIHRIRPHENLDFRYLYYDFLHKGRTGEFASMFTGATIKHLPGQNLAKIEIAIPPLDIQRRIADILSTYDDLIENNRRRIDLLEQSARMLYKEWFVSLRFPGHEHVKVKDGVPQGWKKAVFADIGEDIRDSVRPEQVDPQTPYIGLEHIPRRSITLMDWGSAEDVTSNKFRFVEGDILFGKIRPYFHKVGFALTDGITSSDTIVMRPTHEKFFSYLLMTASSDARVRLSPAGLPSASVTLGSSRVSTLRLCAFPSNPPMSAAASLSASSPLWPKGGWPRSCARPARSVTSGFAPIAAPNSRLI